MTKFKGRIKFLLKVIIYITIIFFIPIIITALYYIYNEGIDSFERGISAFLLIILSTLLLLIICNQLKNGLIFSSNKLKLLESLVKNKILKNILKILLRIILYSFVFFLSALIIIFLIDFSDENLKIFPLETTQFLIMIAFLSILFMLYKDLKKLYNLSSNKIKFLEELSQKIIGKTYKIKEKIFTIKFDFFKKILENFQKISSFISDKIEKFVDLLKDKFNYPEKNGLKDRCNFSNIRNELTKFTELSHQVLLYLTLLASCCIFIPVVLIMIYQFLIYSVTLLSTIWNVLVAIITYL